MNYLDTINFGIKELLADPDEFVNKYSPVKARLYLDSDIDIGVERLVRSIIASIAANSAQHLSFSSSPKLIRIVYGNDVGLEMIVAAANYRLNRIYEDASSSPPELTTLMWEKFTPERRLVTLLGVPYRLYAQLCEYMSPTRAAALLLLIFERLKDHFMRVAEVNK